MQPRGHDLRQITSRDLPRPIVVTSGRSHVTVEGRWKAGRPLSRYEGMTERPVAEVHGSARALNVEDMSQ